VVLNDKKVGNPWTITKMDKFHLGTTLFLLFCNLYYVNTTNNLYLPILLCIIFLYIQTIIELLSPNFIETTTYILLIKTLNSILLFL